MTVNYVLAWIVASTLLRFSFAILRFPGHRRTGLLAVQGVILGVLVLGLALDPAHAGFAGAAALTVLYLLPALAGHFAVRLAARQRHRQAEWLMRLAALLPGYGMRDQRPIFLARQLLAQGRYAEARALLEAAADGDTRAARLARMYLYRI